MRLAVIPARGGSKRIPFKNTKMFHGKPLIAWTVEAAKRSGLFDRILILTNSQPAARVAFEYGVSLQYMPDEISGDNVPVIDAVRHVARSGTVALLYATSPTMTGETLRNACSEFEAGDKTSPLLSISVDGGGLLDDAGMFCFYDAAHIKRENFRFYYVPGAIDMNTPEDFARVDEMFNSERN